MEKLYRMLDWLTLSQALDWLETLTETKVSDWNLLQLCESGQCDAYLKVYALDGVSADFMHSVISASGMQKVLNPIKLLHCGEHNETVLDFFGFACTQDIETFPGNDVTTKEMELEWSTKISMYNHSPQFKRTDIESLAAKMNGTAEHASEVNDLRQQLELVSGALKAAETELLQRRSEDGLRTLDKMRNTLMHDHKEFSTMQWRAEQAELIAASTERQLRELSERQQRDAVLLAKMTERLGEHQKGEKPSSQTETPNTGLTFSRSTKSLQAAHAASLKFWSDYDPLRPPLQKQITAFMIERGVPARQAAELAIAIKPDDLPKSVT